MKVQLAPILLQKLKKQDVRIQKSFKKTIEIFSKDPTSSELNNHELHREWEGFKSIDIIADWRAIYQEIGDGDEVVAYFAALGTHSQIYK
jgi:addiction module RelE/StbE family toxin